MRYFNGIFCRQQYGSGVDSSGASRYVCLLYAVDQGIIQCLIVQCPVGVVAADNSM